ncbi:hypothetical protein P153DRAFT_387930 [Dothidotthia symphoricarpi CBS 119687]|uniref:Uncharacterized protein n=1 Tax=Dothidotthia symphoricarpi CBS 119687 TaxID=1392245 RepID=A0A6A6A968_9PLEO|nr:uncharacterized protein P153DRAFT_387930 [Dothidotthia symphoricarpi CBS 119687]KAF2127387.1 hypothetical protein P153DRAFT_387930 [Dothidotthia symphoricarpi CBS 119687]
MLLARLSHLACFAASAHALGSALPACHVDGRTPDEAPDEACAQPISHVVAVTPGSLYAAKIGCRDCEVVERYGEEGAERKHRVVKSDYALFFNVSLAHDKRTVLLNHEPVFPHLATVPGPPRLYATQLRPTFSYANLSAALACPNPSCRQAFFQHIQAECVEWCYDLALGAISLDYLYTAAPTDAHAADRESPADAKYWELALDAIGGSDGYEDDAVAVFDKPEQKMLRVVVAGTEAKTETPQPGSSLFGSVGDEDKVYEYRIVDVALAPRRYRFPAKTPRTVWQSIRTFFGMDIWDHDGQLVYLSREWGDWGKKGTLRDMFGHFVHWHLWSLVWIIVASTVGGLVVLYGLYRLVLLVLQQRELARWDGMDAVWEQVRRERTDEEENALLHGAYRDDPGEEGSTHPPVYSDETHTMKPLPTKPLPEKPLPDVPLIDAE